MAWQCVRRLQGPLTAARTGGGVDAGARSTSTSSSHTASLCSRSMRPSTKCTGPARPSFARSSTCRNDKQYNSSSTSSSAAIDSKQEREEQEARCESRGAQWQRYSVAVPLQRCSACSASVLVQYTYLLSDVSHSGTRPFLLLLVLVTRDPRLIRQSRVRFDCGSRQLPFLSFLSLCSLGSTRLCHKCLDRTTAAQLNRAIYKRSVTALQ